MTEHSTTNLTTPSAPPVFVPEQQTMLDGLTIKDLLIQARRGWLFLKGWFLWFLAAGIIGGVAGGVLGYLSPPGNLAYAKLRLTPTVSENPVTQYDRKNVEFFRSASANFLSPPLIRESLAECAGTSVTEARLASVRDRVSFYSIGHQTYYASYAADEAEGTVEFLRAHLNRFLRSEIDKTLRTIQAEADFLGERMTQLKQELEASEAALMRFKANHADGLPEQARDHNLRLHGLLRKEIELKAKLEQAELELKLNNEKLTGEKVFVESKVISTQRDEPYQDTIIAAKHKLAEAKAAKLRDDHPEMKRLRALIATLSKLSEEAKQNRNTEIEQTRNPIYESIKDTIYHLEIERSVHEKELERTTREVEAARRIVDKLPALEAEYKRLTRNYDTTSKLYDQILTRHKVVELQVELERASLESRYDIITPPRLEYTSMSKHIGMRVVLFGVALTMMMVGFAFLVEVKKYIAANL